MRCGYTLIELLAVAAILGIAAGLGVPALVRSAAGDPLTASVQQLERQERTVRRLAQGRGASLALAADGWIARVADQESTARVAHGVTLDWRIAQASLSQVAIDDYGRSLDIEVEVRFADRVRRYAIAGLSGEWRMLDDPGIVP